MQDDPGAAGETLCAGLRPPAGQVMIAAMGQEHADAVLAIYQMGIDEGNATFETTAPAWPAFSAARLAGHRFVALGSPADNPDQPELQAAAGAAGTVLGWVAVSATSPRPAYSGVVEHSVYVHPGARGRGIGRLLLGRLIASTEEAGIWTIQSGIFPENTASIALHLAAGFRIVGRRERIGQQHGRWRDILLLERRTPRW
ncbi:MAG TPA: GNAT family N-acetyltransferase [Streptosporangiaceae bacterium]